MNISSINANFGAHKNFSPKFGNSGKEAALEETLSKVPKLLNTVVNAYEANFDGEVDESGSTVYKGNDKFGNFCYESRTADGNVYIGNDSQQMIYSEGNPITMYTDTKGANATNYVLFNPVNNETRIVLEEYGQVVYGADGKRYDFENKKDPLAGVEIDFSS